LEVMLDLACEAVDGEDMATSQVVLDPGEKGPQTFRVGGRFERSLGWELPQSLVLDTDCVAERSETLLRTFEIGGHTLLDGTSKFEEVNVSCCTRGSRVHPGTLTFRR